MVVVWWSKKTVMQLSVRSFLVFSHFGAVSSGKGMIHQETWVGKWHGKVASGGENRKEGETHSKLELLPCEVSLPGLHAQRGHKQKVLPFHHRRAPSGSRGRHLEGRHGLVRARGEVRGRVGLGHRLLETGLSCGQVLQLLQVHELLLTHLEHLLVVQVDLKLQRLVGSAAGQRRGHHRDDTGSMALENDTLHDHKVVGLGSSNSGR